MEKIGEKPQPVMLGGSFTTDEKWLLVELALLNNKWTVGKQVKSSSHHPRKPGKPQQFDLFKRVNKQMFPQPDDIVSKLCKEGQEQALQLFEARKRELLQARRAEADASAAVQQAADSLRVVAAAQQITDPEVYINTEHKLMDEFVHRMREKENSIVVVRHVLLQSNPDLPLLGDTS